MEIAVSQIIFQIINFSIIVIVLLKFLYKPILKVLDQRSQKISQGAKAADENLKVQEEMDEKVKTELKKARNDANKLVKSTQVSADSEAADIIAKAKSDAKKILTKERASLEASIAEDKKKLEQDFVGMVTQTTQELLTQYLSNAEQKKIVDAQVKELKQFKFS